VNYLAYCFVINHHSNLFFSVFIVDIVKDLLKQVNKPFGHDHQEQFNRYILRISMQTNEMKSLVERQQRS